jgi:hypothetical protein
MKITMAAEALDSSLVAAFGDGLAMDTTIVLRPERAADMAISMGPADQKLEMGYRVIGDRAWVNLGSWTETSAEDAEATMDSFAPEKMFAGFGSLPGLTAVGEETKNGVATTHYTATGTDYAGMLNEQIGLANGTWTVDYWVAKDGGYPVAYVLEGAGDGDARFSTELELSDINSPSNQVEVPVTGS